MRAAKATSVYRRLIVVEDDAMTVREFRDNDAGYLTWLAAHPDGHVINIARSHKTTEARIHRAVCRTIRGEKPRGGTWIAPSTAFANEDKDKRESAAEQSDGEPSGLNDQVHWKVRKPNQQMTCAEQ